jgi:hypothetical protein
VHGEKRRSGNAKIANHSPKGAVVEIESFIRIVVIIFAVVLFLVASYLYLSKSTGAASSAMGFVILLVVVLTISNYKRIQGFGFEAEMWDDKQAQAAKLIDRLELLSRASTQQVAQIAAKLGLWDSGFSNPELEKLIDVSRKILGDTGTSDAERQNILAPLYRRVTINYVNAAHQIVNRALTKEREDLASLRRTTPPEDAPALQQQMQTVDEEIKQFSELNVMEMIDHRTIQPFQNFVRDAPKISPKSEVSAELVEISTDMSYFETNGSLRREIDWSYLYK